MAKKEDSVKIDISGLGISKQKEEKKEQYRCEYCRKVFEYKPVIAFLKPSANYEPKRGYPAFQFCSEECKELISSLGGYDTVETGHELGIIR